MMEMEDKVRQAAGLGDEVDAEFSEADEEPIELD
jgi:hypothetical protein